MVDAPRCVQRGVLPIGMNTSNEKIAFAEVYCDSTGALWGVGRDRLSIFHVPASVVDDFINCQPITTFHSPSQSLSPIYEVRSSQGQFIQSILFLMTEGSIEYACVVTSRGSMAVFATHNVRQIVSQTEVGMSVTCACLHSSNSTGAATQMFVACYDGECSEVLLMDWSDALAAVSPTTAVPPRALGLFRITGAVSCLFTAASTGHVFSVSIEGNVDVWSLVDERDVTAEFGTLGWDTQQHGAPVVGCGVLLPHGALWVGTDTGNIVICPLVCCGAGEREGDGGGASEVTVIAAHTPNAVQCIFTMGIGRSVWSYAGDRQVRVWEASSGDLQGSFMLPDAGSQTLCRGPTKAHTPVWGVDRTTGEVSSLLVTERVTRSLLSGNEDTDSEGDVRGRRDGVIARQQLVGVLRQLANMAEGGRPVEGWPPEIDNEECAQDVACVADALGVLHHAITRLSDEHDDEVDNYDSGAAFLLAGIELMLEDSRRLSILQQSAGTVLASARAALQPSAPLDTLDDVSDLLLDRCEELQALREQGDAMDTAPPLVQRLKEELTAERAARRECEAALAEAEADRAEAVAQAERTQKLLESSEVEVAMLRRSLEAAKTAADVVAVDTSRVFDMEAKLHEAMQTISQMQQSLESLRGAEEARREIASQVEPLQKKIQLFTQREDVSMRVVEDLLTTQRAIAETVGHVARACVSESEADDLLRYGAYSRVQLEKRLLSLEASVLELEALVDEKVIQQKRYFAILREELSSV